MPDAPIRGDEILAALRSLGRHLERASRRADLYIFGGAAMVIAYKLRPATRDIDAVFEPDTEVREAALEVAEERGLPRSWLNNQASTYLSRLPDEHRRLVMDEPGIRVMAASPEHLLAMKVMAARLSQDAGDVRLLVDSMGLKRVADAEEIVRAVFPDASISERAHLMLEDIFAQRQLTQRVKDRFGHGAGAQRRPTENQG